ncbi:thioredoxin domain-containing protein [Terrimonas alba]|uniref:thioredoxin domain-containing protein n=1 Tax=Terrimonas alba TaxID=3349636 RepID=UPI0035F29708
MPTYKNKLSTETSPYLLQHAHNPVDWYPWGEEALQKAKEEDKPILISIGYAACHWCHVMEKESFEDESTALIMNEHFVNIKIDREERPDLDHIYMDAVQAMTGSGGWPLNVFLTPSTKPFYGGTYFPPVRAFNRASWKETLLGVINAFNEKRNEIEEQAENLTGHLLQSNSFGLQKPGAQSNLFTGKKLSESFANIMKTADKEWGGFGRAPKFPQTFTIQFLLRYAHIKSQQSIPQEPVDEEANASLKQALLSLDKMIDGGIYDQIGGGFARYSTDTEWLVPHFEKMLYDNALLISALSEAYQLTKKDKYANAIHETMNFIRLELLHPQFGFYSALDADSEGEEGKFYVWSKTEVEQILGEKADIFCRFYNITQDGNWEGKNILRVKTPVEDFARENNIEQFALTSLLKGGRQRLLEKRNTRVRPLLDDKIILSWNALMNTASSKAYAATGKEEYRDLAIANMQFLLERFCTNNSESFFHTWKNEEAKYPAFLDDYAFLIEALIHLQEITADTKWLEKAKSTAEFVIDNFSEPGATFFFYTGQGQTDVIVRKKEVYDGAVPSGNAVMAENLHRLSLYFDRRDWSQRSQDMVLSLGQVITKYPTSFGYWNRLLLESTSGTAEVAVLGTEIKKFHKELLSEFMPQRVLMASSKENDEFPLLAGKAVSKVPSVYICRNFACLKPVSSIAEARKQIRFEIAN